MLILLSTSVPNQAFVVRWSCWGYGGVNKPGPCKIVSWTKRRALKESSAYPFPNFATSGFDTTDVLNDENLMNQNTRLGESAAPSQDPWHVYKGLITLTSVAISARLHDCLLKAGKQLPVERLVTKELAELL